MIPEVKSRTQSSRPRTQKKIRDQGPRIQTQVIQNGIIGRPRGLHLCMILYYNILWLAWHQAIHARKTHSVWVQASSVARGGGRGGGGGL